jgi:GT2 family glycosyltransferase
MIYRRDTAASIGGYDEAFDGVWGYEDTDFAHRLITRGQARPVFLPDIEVYHQDSELSAHEADRFDKQHNRNWHMIIERIPGIEEFKLRQYQKISQDIVTG